MKVRLKLPIVPEHIHIIKRKGCGDSTPTPYRLSDLQIILLVTLVILVQISGLIGYPSVILSLALEARDGRDNCLKVLVY